VATFASSCAHARLLQEQYSAAGVFAAYVDADTPDDERDAIKRSMERGETEVVVNVDVLTTGVDWPFIDCIQIARPTKSEMRWVQTIGRGLRTSKETGKKDCLILDHTDSWARLGNVTEIHHDCLDDGSGTKTAPKPRSEEAQPKACPKCHFIKPARTPTCPKCGFTTQVQAKVVVMPGKLEKVSKSKKTDPSQADKERWYQELIGYALRHGFKPGYGYFRFVDKFGHKPSTRYSKLPLDPSAEVSGWMTHYNIRKRHSRKNSRNAEVRP
jgi:DNA repair protein RadD